jgi:cytochrome c biogenesis protein CcdA
VIALILLVVSVGLADAVNPSTLAPAFLIVTGADAVRRLARFTLGVFLVSLAGGVALVLGPGQLLLNALPHPEPHEKAIVQLVGGLILVALAVGLWLGRHKLGERLNASESANGDKGAFALGAGIMAVELPTALPYFAAIAAIVAAHVHLAAQLALVLLYNVVFVSPLLALIAARRFAGESMSAKLDSIGDWLRERAIGLLAGLLGVAGVAVAGVGTAGLI